MKGIISIICLLSTISCTRGTRKRIIKGLDAPEGKFSYHAYLNAPTGSHTFCGGSIIHKRWILTAAHCFKDDRISDLRVRVGSTSVTDEGGQIFCVKKRIAHEAFNRITLENDIALLYLDKKIKFNRKVQPITLAKRDQSIDDNENVIFTGFGAIQKTDIGPMYNQKLQSIHLKMYGYQRCKNLVKRIAETQICTITKNGEGPYKGDSGGALVNDYGIQVGIDSHSLGPAGEVPEIYTRVSNFRDWIDEKIKRN